MLYALYMAWSLIHIYQYQHTELQGDIVELLFGWFQRPELWNLAETLEAIVHCFGQIAIGSVDKFLVHRCKRPRGWLVLLYSLLTQSQIYLPQGKYLVSPSSVSGAIDPSIESRAKRWRCLYR